MMQITCFEWDSNQATTMSMEVNDVIHGSGTFGPGIPFSSILLKSLQIFSCFPSKLFLVLAAMSFNRNVCVGCLSLLLAAGSVTVVVLAVCMFLSPPLPVDNQSTPSLGTQHVTLATSFSMSPFKVS